MLLTLLCTLEWFPAFPLSLKEQLGERDEITAEAQQLHLLLLAGSLHERGNMGRPRNDPSLQSKVRSEFYRVASRERG